MIACPVLESIRLQRLQNLVSSPSICIKEAWWKRVYVQRDATVGEVLNFLPVLVLHEMTENIFSILITTKIAHLKQFFHSFPSEVSTTKNEIHHQ
jgi:hypothetical protein